MIICWDVVEIVHNPQFTSVYPFGSPTGWIGGETPYGESWADRITEDIRR
jgi:hypothetical protein